MTCSRTCLIDFGARRPAVSQEADHVGRGSHSVVARRLGRQHRHAVEVGRSHPGGLMPPRDCRPSSGDKEFLCRGEANPVDLFARLGFGPGRDIDPSRRFGLAQSSDPLSVERDPCLSVRRGPGGPCRVANAKVPNVPGNLQLHARLLGNDTLQCRGE